MDSGPDSEAGVTGQFPCSCPEQGCGFDCSGGHAGLGRNALGVRSTRRGQQRTVEAVHAWLVGEGRPGDGPGRRFLGLPRETLTHSCRLAKKSIPHREQSSC